MPRAATDVTILDGGLSTVLAGLGCDVGSDLWTAAALRDSPATVVEAHRLYFAAGAQVATTSSYQASIPGLVASGLSVEEAESLLRLSVRLARDARDAMPDPVGLQVAASVGPYGAALADGSEYRGDYGVGASTLRDFHARRLEVLASAGPDLFAVETIPDVREAEVLVPLLDDLGVPAWLSYSVADGATRAGQPLVEAFAVAAGSEAVVAAGVNCCDPTEVPTALAAVTAAGIGAGVAYPNAGRAWDSATHTWAGTSRFDAGLVPGWVAAGARYVGGCCEVGPDDIAAVSGALAR